MENFTGNSAERLLIIVAGLISTGGLVACPSSRKDSAAAADLPAASAPRRTEKFSAPLKIKRKSGFRGTSNVRDKNGEWLYTGYRGKTGFIHSDAEVQLDDDVPAGKQPETFARLRV